MLRVKTCHFLVLLSFKNITRQKFFIEKKICNPNFLYDAGRTLYLFIVPRTRPFNEALKPRKKKKQQPSQTDT